MAAIDARPILRRGVSALRTVTALSHRPPTIRPMCNHDFRASMKALPNFLAAATLALGLATPALAVDITGAGATFPYPDLRQVGRGLQAEDRHRHELPVDRLRRRHRADQGEDRRLRRVRHAAQARRAAGRRPDAVSRDHRRRRAGREHRRRRARRDQVHRPGARRHLPRQDQEVERQADRRSQSRRQAARRDRSPSCAARTARARRSSGPTTCRRSAPSGRRRSAPAPRWRGRKAWAARATKASRPTCSGSRARSATSNTRTPSRTR